jgi:hypothetical protein
MSEVTMNSSAAAAEFHTASSKRSAAYWLCASAILIMVSQLYYALAMGINWDEFQQYDSVRRLASGALEASLQTFHAHLFAWLLQLPGDVTDHIRSARIIMLLCEIGIAITLFSLARRFASKTAAALIALAYLSGGYVVTQASAFRADPQATVLLMGALWLLAYRPLRPATIIVFGALTGLAAMLTVKVVFYAPVFAGMAWLRWHDEARKAKFAWQLAACIASSLLAFAILYAWHSSYVTKPPLAAGMKTISSSWRVVFAEGLVPRWPFLVRQLMLAPHVTALIALTVIFWSKLKLSRWQRHAMIGLMLPLAVLLIYRNSYPYFFVFLLPPVLLATAPAMEQILLRRYGVMPLAVFMALLSAFLAFHQPRGILEDQKRVIAVAHELFPEPVTYFDECGYLGDYDRAISYMVSGWGLKEYRRRGVPQLVQIMERKTVPLLIANNYAFKAALDNELVPGLLEEDAKALRESYIHHWGPLWVAGRHIPAGSDPFSIHIRVPGKYTVENGELMLDGVLHKAGEVIELTRGQHEIDAPRYHDVTLRWGDHIGVPSVPATDTIPYQIY